MGFEINVKVKGHEIIQSYFGPLAAGSDGFDLIKPTFDSAWDGMTIKAVMYQRKNKRIPITAVNGAYPIPAAVLEEGMALYIGFDGTSADGKVYGTTNMLRFEVGRGASASSTPGITPQEESNLVPRIAKLEAEVSTIKEDLNDHEERISYLEQNGTGGGTGTGGSGSVVTVTPSLTSGTKVADITVNGSRKTLYAPTPVDYSGKYSKPSTGIPESDLSAEVKEKLNRSGDGGGTVDLSDVVHLTRTIELHLGNELFGDNMVAEFPEGWSYSESGLTHPANNTNVLKINPPMTEGHKYLVTITTSTTVVNGFCVYMEGEYPVNVYAGTNISPVVIVANSSGKICISNDTRAASNPAFTITGISVKEVLESGGTDYRINRQNVDTHGLPQNGVGFWNVAIGLDNLQKSITGSRNVSIGEHSMEELKHGARNIGVGTYTMQKLVNGEDNIAIGADALQFNTACYNNVAIGRSALENNNAEYNMAIGAFAMQNNRVGLRNCAVGSDALRDSTGNDNVGIGKNAGRRSNECNTCIGGMAGYFNKGKRNVAIGYNAKIGTAQNEFFDCIVLGANAGATDSQQIVIGSSAQKTLQIMGKTINFNADGSVTWS